MTLSPSKFDHLCSEFEAAVCPKLEKLAFIRKMPNGEWAVLSEKGKSLGKYKTKNEAVKRLRQVKYFKHHKKKAADEDSYSSIMRELNENKDERIDEFQKVFKETFDSAYIDGDDKPEDIALEKAKEVIAEQSYNDMLFKAASAIEMGDPIYAGKYLAELVKFLLRRISHDKQSKARELMKRKVYFINEYDIASKKLPTGAAYGQGIVLIKNVLMEHSPKYIRAVLNSIVRNL